jgi:hypothetical protein
VDSTRFNAILHNIFGWYSETPAVTMGQNQSNQREKIQFNGPLTSIKITAINDANGTKLSQAGTGAIISFDANVDGVTVHQKKEFGSGEWVGSGSATGGMPWTANFNGDFDIPSGTLSVTADNNPLTAMAVRDTDVAVIIRVFEWLDDAQTGMPRAGRQVGDASSIIISMKGGIPTWRAGSSPAPLMAPPAPLGPAYTPAPLPPLPPMARVPPPPPPMAGVLVVGSGKNV